VHHFEQGLKWYNIGDMGVSLKADLV